LFMTTLGELAVLGVRSTVVVPTVLEELETVLETVLLIVLVCAKDEVAQNKTKQAIVLTKVFFITAPDHDTS